MNTPLPPPSLPPQVPVVPDSSNDSWWKNKWMRLPVWAWIVIGVLGIGAIGNATAKKDDGKTAAATANGIDETIAPPASLPSNLLGGDSPEDSLMPSVVCMSLQEAQDEIQDHGVFYSRSEDATGQGRMQVIDSNWQVVAQSPEPGTPIGEGDALLSVVKSGEQPNPC